MSSKSARRNQRRAKKRAETPKTDAKTKTLPIAEVIPAISKERRSAYAPYAPSDSDYVDPMFLILVNQKGEHKHLLNSNIGGIRQTEEFQCCCKGEKKYELSEAMKQRRDRGELKVWSYNEDLFCKCDEFEDLDDNGNCSECHKITY